MPALTPQFIFDFESNMRLITENEYLRLTQADHQWWDKVTKTITSGSRREIINWILNTASLEDQGTDGGNFAFEDMVMLETEITHRTAGKGLKLKRQDFEDLDGHGVQLGTEWAAQMGAQHGYWPQKQISTLLKGGLTALAYDGQNFFSGAHPVNPKNLAAGTYSNNIASVPIDSSVPLDVAQANLAKVYASIASIKMPNGKDPRFLRPAGILCSPTLYPRAVQLTQAKFIAMAAASGGGSADTAGIMGRQGYGLPTEADELSGFESGLTYYVFAEQIAGSQMGAFLYSDREPFSIRYFTGRGGGTGVDAILDRSDMLEWLTSGRNAATYGHPYMIFRCQPGA